MHFFRDHVITTISIQQLMSENERSQAVQHKRRGREDGDVLHPGVLEHLRSGRGVPHHLLWDANGHCGVEKVVSSCVHCRGLHRSVLLLLVYYGVVKVDIRILVLSMHHWIGALDMIAMTHRHREIACNITQAINPSINISTYLSARE